MRISGWSWLLAMGMTILAASGSSAQVRVSVASDGTLANSDSGSPALSDGARFVAFSSFATNLVAGDTNGLPDVFLRDRDADGNQIFDEPGGESTIRISERPGIQGNGPSTAPVMSADGRYVFFVSQATTFFSVGQPALPFTEIFRWDRTSGSLILVSRNTDGEPLNQASFSPAFTSDGNTVYFVTYATNGPVPNIGAGGMIVRRDIAAGTLTAVSDPLGLVPGAIRAVEQPSVSSDGRVLAYGIVDREPQTRVRLRGTIVVREGTAAPRTFTGLTPMISRDGRYLTGIDSAVGAPGPAFRGHLATGTVRRILAYGTGDAAAGSPTGRYVQADGALVVDFQYGSNVGAFLSNEPMAFDGFDFNLAYARRGSPPEREFQDVFVESTAAAFDNDRDGLNDHWEMLFGLGTGTPGGATGADGANGDPDNDGLTNAQEFARGSNPVGTFTRLLPEGTSSPDFFSTRIAIVNPGGVDAKVSAHFDIGAATGFGMTRTLVVPARTRVTLDSHDENMDGFSFSTEIESDQPVVVDRLVSWGTAAAGIYGSHAETAIAAPGTSWLLAEGSTVLGFQLFYLLQNPNDVGTTATIRSLRPSGAPIVETYPMPPHTRSTLYVNSVPGLESTDVSAEITADHPIAVERAMYRNSSRGFFELGHDAAAVPTAATTWLFAEGSSNAFFDTYLLMANPGATPATVTVAYLRDEGGPLTQTYTVAAGARYSVFVDGVPDLGAGSYGIRVTSDQPIVAERAMYWAGGFFDYYEGHVSAGANTPGGHWVLAEHEVGTRGAAPFEAVSFTLIANTGTVPASFRVRTIPEAGGTAKATGLITLAAGARVTIPATTLGATGRFGVEVTEEGTATGALIVEGSIYWSNPGQPFAAGANWPATRLP